MNPCARSRSFSSVRPSTMLTARASRATTGCGAFAGASIPTQDWASNPLSASATVGTSGSCGTRSRPATPSARSLPPHVLHEQRQ